jgi:uncharacterized membrane protein YphA (DoxX/SURF4 family)
MNAVASAVRQWWVDLFHDWDRFWFTPVNPATLCAVRICTGLMLLYTHLVWGKGLEDFFGPDGWLMPDAVHAYHNGWYTWSYFWWLESPAQRLAAHVAALVVFALLTVGLWSRVVSILAAVATLSYIHRAPGSLFGLDQINALLAMYLCVGPSGARYSVDAWLKRRRAPGTVIGQGISAYDASISANIALRLIQVHMCVIYFFAGTSKLMGLAWWNGLAMWLAFGNYEYQSIDMTWLADWPWTLSLLAHVTIVWEVFYCVLIWSRRWRPVMLILAVPLHLGIAFCLGMVTFGLAMLIGNLAFVSPQVIEWTFGGWRKQTTSN